MIIRFAGNFLEIAQYPGNDKSLHLGGTTAYLREFRVTKEPLDRIFMDEAVPAEYLDCFACRLHAPVTDQRLRNGGMHVIQWFPWVRTNVSGMTISLRRSCTVIA